MVDSSSSAARNGRKPSKTLFNTNDGNLLEAFQRFLKKSHAADYLGLSLLITGYILLKLLSEPFHQQFRLDDPRIQHPHARVERVPVVSLMIYAAVLPAAVLVAWVVILRPDMHKSHVTILGFFISLMTTLFLTDLFKDAIGRPRPDLVDRCIPDLDTPKNEMVSVDVCTETNHHILHDGWRSFPSGHSSFSFAGLGWLAIFLASQTHVLRPRANMATVLLCLVPLLGAALIAVSRLEDYRHDVFDVMTGSALGLSVAFFNWRRYYPSLLAKNCDEVYPLLHGNGRTSPGGFQRVRDEEDGYVCSPDNEIDHD